MESPYGIIQVGLHYKEVQFTKKIALILINKASYKGYTNPPFKPFLELMTCMIMKQLYLFLLIRWTDYPATQIHSD